MTSPVARALRLAALPLLWLSTVGMMARDWSDDPYDPGLEGTSAYGHNGEGALVDGIVLSLVELAVLVAILRPWSYDRSWGRALVAVALLVPWTLLSMVMSMHMGGIFAIHWMWLALLLVGTTVTLLRSLVGVYMGLSRR